MGRKHGDLFTYRNYINGEWVVPDNASIVDNVNPATGDVLGRVVQSTTKDVHAAVKAAKEAQKSWRLVPAPERGELLYAIGQLLKERKEHLARTGIFPSPLPHGKCSPPSLPAIRWCGSRPATRLPWPMRP